MEVCNGLRKLNVNTLLYLLELQFKKSIRAHVYCLESEEGVVHALMHFLMRLISFTGLAC